MRSGTLTRRHKGITNRVKWVSHMDDMQQLLEKRSRWALRYIGGAVRNQAKRGMGRNKRKQSQPGNPANSPPPNRVLNKTIYREFLKKPQYRVVVGPKLIAYQQRGQSMTARSVPQFLEYGGTKRVTKTQYTPRKMATAQQIRDEKARRLRRWRKKRRNTTGKAPKISLRKINYVTLPPGTYTTKPRPTMRLAFNKTVIQTNQRLVRAFKLAGIRNPATWTRTISDTTRF